ncbi:hypothetical protein CAP36_15135 [Chitinophagaceae bacterium IBVUCB2]|nr:hypothetical protein CAP36_15135 [Chitinophagaceae bacterium IBVUCB2]
MISIVICSKNPEHFDTVKKNIEVTIGVAYEIICIDNSIDKNSICSVYNKGALKAKYELVCFLHEDIQFRSNNWGQIIINAFNEKEVGLMGVAGTYYYSLPPLGWFNTCEQEVNVIHTPEPDKTSSKLLYQSRFSKKNIVEVVAIDGVFMITRKEILRTVRFDEEMLDNFHGYDIDLSLQIRQTHKIVVSKEVLLEHFSKSLLTQQWFDALFKISRKWKNILPTYIAIYTKKEIKKLNQESIWDFYFMSAAYLNKRKRLWLYFYYSSKLSALPISIHRLLRYYFDRFVKNK